MTRLAVSAGVPLAEADRVSGRHWVAPAPPTGDVDTTGAWAATITASATPHTKGSYTEVIAATSADAFGLEVFLSSATGASTTDTSVLLDIAVGAASSEVVVVPDLGVGWKNGATGLYNFIARVPVFIPKGSRVSARSQSTLASKTAALVIVPVGRQVRTLRPSTKVVTVGADAANSRGTALTVSGVANTKGAWTQITAAADESFRGLLVTAQGAGDTSQTTGTGLLDIGVGASGNEQVVLSNVPLSFSASEFVQVLTPGVFFVAIPKGSRIAARFQATSTGNSVDVCVHLVR